jgi:hypothetical protein
VDGINGPVREVFAELLRVVTEVDAAQEDGHGNFLASWKEIVNKSGIAVECRSSVQMPPSPFFQDNANLLSEYCRFPGCQKATRLQFPHMITFLGIRQQCPPHDYQLQLRLLFGIPDVNILSAEIMNKKKPPIPYQNRNWRVS